MPTLSSTNPMNPPPRHTLFGLSLDAVTMSQTLDRIGEMVRSRRPHRIATANVDFVVRARHDSTFASILNQNDLVACDGTPLVWASRWFGKALPERVAGSDLTPRLLEEAARRGWRVYFLGGAPEVLTAAVENVKKTHPGLAIAGYESPPYQPLEAMDHAGICERIRASRADIVFVSFGCPKQERWIDLNYRDCGASVCIGVGATIDFLAGSMRRAPRWMQRIGAEWIFRLAQEPRRLFKRYAADLVGFLRCCVREALQPREPQARGPEVSPPVTPLEIRWPEAVTLPETDGLWCGTLGALWNAFDRQTGLKIDLGSVRRMDRQGVELVHRVREQAHSLRTPVQFVNTRHLSDQLCTLAA